MVGRYYRMCKEGHIGVLPKERLVFASSKMDSIKARYLAYIFFYSYLRKMVLLPVISDERWQRRRTTRCLQLRRTR
jgi:hypothetical protein